MIEIQAKLLRGPVYFSEETIQCLITLRNTPLQSSASSSGESLSQTETGIEHSKQYDQILDSR